VARLPVLGSPSQPVHTAQRSSRQVQRRLSPNKIAQLVADYQAGTGTEKLALDYGISRDTVSKHIKRAGVPVPCPGPYRGAEGRSRTALHRGLVSATTREALRSRRRDYSTKPQEASSPNAKPVGENFGNLLAASQISLTLRP